MISKNLAIINKLGLHARPASNFVKLASQYKCNITIKKGTNNINVKSILGIMGIGAKCGTTIELSCNGEDEVEAMEALEQAIAAGLGE